MSTHTFSRLQHLAEDLMKVGSHLKEVVQYQRHGALGHEQAQRPKDGRQKYDNLESHRSDVQRLNWKEQIARTKGVSQCMSQIGF